VFFQGLHLLVHQNPSAIISKDDFIQARIYLSVDPVASLEAISKIPSPRLIFILGVAWEKYLHYGYYSSLFPWQRSWTPNQKTLLIFGNFEMILKNMIFYQYYSEVNDISDHRKIIKSVALILEKMGHSELTFDVECYDMHRFSFTTGGYVKFLNNLYNILLEPDSVKGFVKAFNRLKLLSQNYNGKIPVDITEKANILSIVIACNYYSCSINRDNFRLLDLKAMDPKMLAFLFHIAVHIDYHLEDIFLDCASGNIVDVVLKKLGIHFKGDLKRYGYENHLYPENLLPRLLKKLRGRELALFKIYAKLLSYYRSRSEYQVHN
jgi:hypothetical protein